MLCPWLLYCRPDHKVVPTELRVNSFDWDLEDILHPSVAMRKIILKKMDTDMRKAGLIRDHPRTILKQALTDKVEDYKALEKAVSFTAIFLCILGKGGRALRGFFGPPMRPKNENCLSQVSSF